MKLLMLICKQKRGQIKLKGFKLADMMHVYSQEVQTDNDGLSVNMETPGHKLLLII